MLMAMKKLTTQTLLASKGHLPHSSAVQGGIKMIEARLSNFQNEISKLQYRVAELEGQVHNLQRDDSLIKDVLHQRILADNKASDSCSEYQWSLVLQPKPIDQRIQNLSCKEHLTVTRSCSSEVEQARSPVRTSLAQH